MRQILVSWKEGYSAEELLSEVRREWDSGVYHDLLFHIYSGVSEEEVTIDVAGKIQACFPNACVAGSMSAGEICEGHELPRGILVSALLFESTEIRIYRYDYVKGREAEVGEEMKQLLDGIPDLKGVELLFPGLEMDTRKLYEVLENCRKEIQIFGGYSGGHQFNSPSHFIFDREAVWYDSIFAITYAGKEFYIDVGKVIGWDSLGMPFKVTKAEGNRLVELDHKPACELYERFLQIDRAQWDNAEAGYEFPMIARYNGEEWLRSTVYIEENGALDLHGYVVEGMEIYLSYGNPSKIVKLVNERLEQVRRFKPQVVFLYSCIVRKQFWDQLVDMEMLPFATLGSVSGFHTWGEVIRNTDTGEIYEHNVTLLSIAMREGAPQKEELPVARVDDTVLRGQASLLRRLASLINTTMTELRLAHNDLQVLNQKLTVLAERDALTGLYNRRKIEQLINHALDRTYISEKPVTLVMIDIDHFKHVNDTYGHETGDAVLKKVAEILKKSVVPYPGAAAGRWGGEEFFLLLPDQTQEEGYAFAERLRKQVAQHIFPNVLYITISLGVIAVKEYTDRKIVYSAVDNALYQAKESGRNRTVIAELKSDDHVRRDTEQAAGEVQDGSEQV